MDSLGCDDDLILGPSHAIDASIGSSIANTANGLRTGQASAPSSGKDEDETELPPAPSLRRQLTAQACSPIVSYSGASGDDASPSSGQLKPVDVLMIGTGEYTTGYVHGSASTSDKGAGVVALTMFDLRSRANKTRRLALCGTNGSKFEGIRSHFKRAISDVYSGLDTSVECFPRDSKAVDPLGYKEAIASFQPGDAVTIFTPDDTHFDIAMACIERGLHVLVTKPAVQSLDHHRQLFEAAEKKGVLVCIEVHKRWDPMYADARDRIVASGPLGAPAKSPLGPFSYMYAYMSQPKQQLKTFSNWAGTGVTDISYYLNSHHIDFHEWCMENTSRPVSVTAVASTGAAKSLFDINCEDTITLTVQWENLDENGRPSARLGLGTAVYTSSWVAPQSDVHSQQRFFYMGQLGEVNIDQAHRGYTLACDGSATPGLRSVNPLFMKYVPSHGKFAGQLGYGYRSLEAFIDAVRELNAGRMSLAECDDRLATLSSTFRTTAILEAGRRSLDEKRTIRIVYNDSDLDCAGDIDELRAIRCRPVGLI